MSATCLADANIILRFLIGDHPKHFDRVCELIQAASRGEIEIVVTPWVIAEVVYVMRSTYGGSNKTIASLLSDFIDGTGIVVRDYDLVADALLRFASRRIDFVDCLLAAHGAAETIPVASFDRDLDRFEDIERLEP